MQDTPKDLDKKRADEKLLVSEMIALYCRRQHKTPKGTLCPECRQLHDYALMRIDKCPFMETKTFCSACRVHCYQPAMREKIRTVRTGTASCRSAPPPGSGSSPPSWHL